MKTINFTLLLMALVLTSCVQRPVATNIHEPNEPLYYAYDPEDTIGNEPYCHILRIDSARAEYRHEHPISEMPTINLDSMDGMEKTPEQRLYDDSLLLAESEAKWFELMRLCSKKQYENALILYDKEEAYIGIALATSTNKFDLDYFVIGPLLFDQLDEEEAADFMAKYLVFDKLLTEDVIFFGESQQGYVPPQYAFQLEILSKVYLMLDEWEKVEALIEPYRKAVYLLSDDTLTNEFAVMDFKLNLYGDMDDRAKIREAFVEFRDFLIQYAKDTHQDLDEQIENMDKLIKSVEEQ